MAYGSAKGRIFRGDIYAEDDSNKDTFIDWGNDYISFAVGGTKVLNVSSSGAVVQILGTVSASSALNVAGATTLEGTLTANKAVTVNNTLTVNKRATLNEGLTLSASSAQTWTLPSTASQALLLYAGSGKNYMVFDTQGRNVVIGSNYTTTNVGGKLIASGTSTMQGVTATTISASSTIQAAGNLSIGNYGLTNAGVATLGATTATTVTGSNGALFLGHVQIGEDKRILFQSNGQIRFNNATTGQSAISLTDNLASALFVGEGANTYLTFKTTDSAEAVVVGQPLTCNAGLTLSSSRGQTWTLPSTSSQALLLFQGSGKDYMNFDTQGRHIIIGSAYADVNLNNTKVSGTLSASGDFSTAGNGTFGNIGSAASAGALHYTATGVLTTNTSDERLKDDITTIDLALDKVKALRGVYHTWKEDMVGERNIGAVAQEVAAVIPELAFTNDNTGYMGVHYDKLSALLIEAIKEQSETIEELQRRVNNLEDQEN